MIVEMKLLLKEETKQDLMRLGIGNPRDAAQFVLHHQLDGLGDLVHRIDANRNYTYDVEVMNGNVTWLMIRLRPGLLDPVGDVNDE